MRNGFQIWICWDLGQEPMLDILVCVHWGQIKLSCVTMMLLIVVTLKMVHHLNTRSAGGWLQASPQCGIFSCQASTKKYKCSDVTKYKCIDASNSACINGILFWGLEVKNFSMGKKGLLSKIRTKWGPVIELLRTFSHYFRNNAIRS